jgi:Tfp pilus assembly protein PilF
VLLSLWSAGAVGCRHAAELGAADRARLARQKASDLTRAASLVRQADPEKARRLLTEAIETDTAYIPARNNLAALYLAEGRLREAAVQLRLAMSLDSQRAAPRFNMALVYERSGRYRAAAEQLEIARQLAPDNLDVQKALVRVWCRLKRPPDKEMRLLVDQLRRRVDDPEWVDWLNRAAQGPTPPDAPPPADPVEQVPTDEPAPGASGSAGARAQPPDARRTAA